MKSHPYLRTNQFEVERNLEGLEERFRVNGRDALADALGERRSTLAQTPSKWHPEILFLLLELSDQPTFNSKLGDLELLKSEDEAAQQQFRWEDIAKEDGWDEDAAIWRSIKYTDSSDDEAYEDDSNAESETTSDTSEDPIVGRTASDLIIQPADIEQLNLIRETQRWRSANLPTMTARHGRKGPVSEFHVTREVLFMLQGLETTLFGKDGAADPVFQMAHLAWETHKALIGYFSEAGRQLGFLRQFIALPQTSPHLQIFRDTLSSRLQVFGKEVSDIQSSILAPEHDIVVSLLSVKGKLAPSLEPLYSLSGIVAQILEAPNSGAFRYLELLFDEVSLSQLSGKLVTYDFLARIFIECFSVYLRPIRLWMDEGRLLPNDKIFFVSEAPTKAPLSQIWQDQYRLRKTADGSLHAPKFLRPAASKIFNAGKNIVVLKRLGRFANSVSQLRRPEPPLDLEAICPAGFELAPFPELFDAAFDRWIQSKYSTTSSTLKNVLFHECGLWTALDALQHLYFMSNGAAAEAFSHNLFAKLDALVPNWNNRYTLTNSSQEAFSLLLDSTRLSISVSPEGMRLSGLAARDSVRTALPTVRVNYRVAWPVQMILSEENMAQYQSIFTLMLQLRRALFVLHRQKLIESYWTDDENWNERALYYSLRTNMLWFCKTLQTYLATLVLAPNSAKMKDDLAEGHGVDAMIIIHAAFLKRVIDEACLGSRLTPIRECILDILDIAIKLEQSQTSHAKEQAEEMQELSRLSVETSPSKGSGTPASKRAKYDRDSDSEDDDENRPVAQLDKPYITLLREMKADFDQRLRFVCGGLRSVARASSDAQSAKWDILAEMLQSGSRGER